MDMQNPSFLSEEDFQYHYAPYVIALTDRARLLRKHKTYAETLFWEAVRGKRFLGLKFVRQKPLIHFIADFYCARLKLVIEIDGDVHDEAKEYDRARTDELEQFGITVIRYSNDDIISNLNSVLDNLTRRAENL
jgi:very-short-patch-repair endonuclease